MHSRTSLWTALLTLTLFASAGTCQAMKVKLISGDLKALKGETLVRVEYVYPENLMVGKISAKQYIEDKRAKLNEDSPGKGDMWAKQWLDSRETRFHPKFEELMNKIFKDKKKPLRISRTADDAKFTLILTATWIDVGWHAGIAARPAFLNAEINIVETANPSRSVAKIQVTKAPGAKAWDVGYVPELRLEESFAKCGKEVANLIVKKGLK